jgi:transcriptional regulator with AAA-type ATPase domain/tetratricopeptide (TPR) repeat protein
VTALADLIGESPAIEAVRREITRLVSNRPRGRWPAVLIQGETGTGKGVVARILHEGGARAGGPFVDVNCAAIPETLLEAELFGFERGAFTDARRSKAGLFQTAHRGTIFLDEVGLLPDTLQAKLLTVLEEQTVRRLGATEAERVDVWVVSASNTDLRAAVRERRFREDLYHRLAVLTLTLPPLRERGRDVVRLAESFLVRACQEYGLPAKHLAPDAEARLLAYLWPGNVREVANLIERVALLGDGDVVTAGLLGLEEPAGEKAGADGEADATLASAEEVARDHLRATLERTGWNISRTAALLGISRNTVRARTERFRLHQGETARSGARGGQGSEPEVAAPPSAVGAGPASTSRAAEASMSPATVRWERRPVTCVRVALVLPDQDERPDTSRTLQLMIDKIRVFGGRVEEIGQAGLDATFGLESLEDAPRRAANAALAVVKGAEDGPPVGRSVRVAMHASPVLVGRIAGAPEIDRDEKRHVSDELDNLLAVAEPGAILLTAATGSLLDRRFDLVPLSGIPGPGRPPLRLAGRGGPRLGFGGRMSRFVGRAQELALLEAWWAAAVGGNGQVVGIVGEPGVGKSRLLWEFIQGQRQQARVFEAAAVVLGTPTPYGPIIDLLRAILGIEPSNDTDTVRAKVTRHVRDLDPAFGPIVPPVLALLDVAPDDAEWPALDAAQRRQRTLDAVKALLVRESRRRPMMLALEDAHWLDSESQTLVDNLVDGLPAAPLLLILTYRPEYRHGWGGRTYYKQLRVDPLGGPSVQELLRDLLGEHPSLADLPARLVEWTEGNPLFLEEIVRSLVETGVLAGDGGAYKLAARVTSLQVPGTVEEVLAHRMDRLRPSERALLQSASVIGRDVPYAVLASTAELPEADLRRSLGVLREGEFLYEASIFPERAYTFKHALTQEVAYRSLLPEAQRKLHARIVEILEAGATQGSADRLDRLAYHAFRGEVWEKAVEYLRQSGRRALLASANREAVELLEQALTALHRLPPTPARLQQALALRLTLRDPLWSLGRVDRIHEQLGEADAIARELGDARGLARTACYLCHYLWAVARLDAALEASERALASASNVGDRLLVAETELYRGVIFMAQGNCAGATHLLQRIDLEFRQLATGASKGVSRVAAVWLHVRCYLTRALAELGRFEEGLTVGQEAVHLAEASGTAFGMVTALAGLGTLYLRKSEPTAAIPLLERGLELCRTYSVNNWLPTIEASLGAAYAGAGRVDDGVRLLEEAVDLHSRTGIVATFSLWRIYLGEAYLRAGRLSESLEEARRALAECRARGERGYEAWALHLLAAVGARQETLDSDDVHTSYVSALERAEELGMRPLALRCLLGLARLGEREGDVAGAIVHRERAHRLGTELGISLMRLEP